MSLHRSIDDYLSHTKYFSAAPAFQKFGKLSWKHWDWKSVMNLHMQTTDQIPLPNGPARQEILVPLLTHTPDDTSQVKLYSRVISPVCWAIDSVSPSMTG